MKKHARFCYVFLLLLVVLNISLGKRVLAENEGTVVAQIKNYEVGKNGYTFQNFGNNQHDASQDLSPEDLIQMFGAKAVCIEGTTPDDCVLYATAEKWMEEAIDSAGGGHCNGFSVSSLRLLRGVEFRGRTKPADWIEGAVVTGHLQRNPEIDNYITYFQTAQSFWEVYQFTGNSYKQTPQKILEILVATMKEGKEHLTLNVFNLKDGQMKDGHSVVPYKVVDYGDGQYRIYVYDNNFPNDTNKFVTLDKNTGEWTYRTASNPAEAENDYFGDDETHTLGLSRISDYERDIFTCPFNPDESEEEELVSLEFSATDESDFTVTDPSGMTLGYNPITQVDGCHAALNTPAPQDWMNINSNKSPGRSRDIFCKLRTTGFDNEDLPPTVSLPFNPEAAKPYTITLFGKELEEENQTDFTINGPDFVVGFEDIQLDPNETLTVTVSADGQELSFTASADGETPTIYFTTESGPDAPSYEFEIGGVSIEAGKTVTATLDLENGKIFFRDNDGNNDQYDIQMTRINPDGSESEFAEEDLDTGNADSFEMDFGKWDGRGKMDFKVDEDGDGFDDEKAVQLDNEYKPKPKKP